MSNTYVFVDYDNIDPQLNIGQELHNVRLIVFVEKRRAQSHALRQASKKIGVNLEIIEIPETKGKRIDIHIAFYLGKVIERDPTANFEIISNEVGYDPLIEHLSRRRVHIRRLKVIMADSEMARKRDLSQSIRIALSLLDQGKAKGKLPAVASELRGLLIAVEKTHDFRLMKNPPSKKTMFAELERMQVVRVQHDETLYYFDAQPMDGDSGATALRSQDFSDSTTKE